MHLKEKATGDFAQPSTSNISSPKVHRGNIGTADSVLMNAEIGEEINEKFRIIAVDMEGYAIGRSATLLHVDFNIIRGISDFSNENKNTDWQKYAALAEAEYGSWNRSEFDDDALLLADPVFGVLNPSKKENEK